LNVHLAGVGLLVLLMSSRVLAVDDPIDRARDTAERAQRAAAASQQRVDALDDQTRALLESYRAATWQAQQLTVFADQLEALSDQQREEQTSLERQIEALRDTEAELMPLMLRMLDALTTAIERDLPFLETERTERVANLQRLMADADTSLAQKYQRLLEAYQIEIDYGRGLDTERLSIDGRAVDMLRVGRLALFALTLDGEQSYYWSPGAKEWATADPGLRRTINQGLRMARDTAPLGLMRLPVPAATDADTDDTIDVDRDAPEVPQNPDGGAS
jgi:hypothetical protein